MTVDQGQPHYLDAAGLIAALSQFPPDAQVTVFDMNGAVGIVPRNAVPIPVGVIERFAHLAG